LGAWGPGLYSCDVALDLKADIASMVRLPVDEETLVGRIRALWPCADEPDDEDHTDFWLVLADQLHGYGIACPPVLERARKIIESETDLEVKQSLEMAPGDLKKRAAVLAKIGAKLAAPHPKPRGRRLLHVPEPFVLDAGACLAYCTQDGNAPNVYMRQSDIDRTFMPNGWGAFIVLARAHKLGYFARHLVARLAVEPKIKPTRESCAASRLSANKFAWSREPPTPAVAWVDVTKPHLKKLGADPLGTLAVDGDAVRRTFDPAPTDEGRDWHTLCGLLQPYDTGARRPLNRAVRLRNMPLSRFLAEPGDTPAP
jgi:hypothetical protein